MHSIVFLDRSTVEADFRKPNFDHRWTDYPTTQPSEVLARLADATVAVTNKVRLREDVLSRAPDLRLIVSAATGVDTIDLEFCKQRGIRVSNVPGYATDGVAEHVFMFLLMLRRNAVGYGEDIHNGLWAPPGPFSLFSRPIFDVAGSTLGIVGYGGIAKKVEHLAKAFGMKVILSERKGNSEIRPGRKSFDDVLRESDVVSLHLPATAQTQGLMGAREFSLMKRSAILINTARGALIEETALAAALREGRIAGAGLDVLSEEPPAPNHPLIALRAPNLIVTPHNAWASRQAMQRLANTVIDNIEAFAKGSPIHVVA